MKGIKMRKTIVVALATAMTLTALAQASRTASLVIANCCESKVDALLLPKLKAVLSTKLSKIGLKTVNPDFFKDKANKAHGRVTVSVWQLQDSKTYIGVASRNHRYSIRMEVNLADARTGASVCGGVEVNTNSPSYSAEQVANHGQKYIDELIDAAAADCARQWKDDLEFRKWIESPPPQQTFPPPPPPEPLTLGDLQRVLEMLSDKMFLSPRFNERHAVVMERRSGKLPVIVVGGIADMTRGRSPCSKLADFRNLGKDFLQTRLGRSCRFEIKDLAAVEAMRHFIVDSPKDPLSDRTLLEALRRYVSPDFLISGHVKYYAEYGLGTYFIHLAVYDFLKGVVVWEDTVEVIKSLPKGTNQ